MCLSAGVSLCLGSSDLHFGQSVFRYSRLGLGLGCPSWPSGRFRPVWLASAVFSVNARGLLAVRLCLHQFQSHLQGRTVAVFCVPATAVAHLRGDGGSRSPLLHSLAQGLFCWPESFFHPPGSTFSSGLLPYPRWRSVSPLLLPRSAWSLALTVFLSFRELRPVLHYFFASSPSRCCPISFSAVTDAHSQCQRAQTRFSILGAVSRLMWLSSHAVSSFTYLSLVIFPGSQSAPASRLAPLQRFTRPAWFPSAIAERSSLARRPSSRAVCLGHWSISLPWCLSTGFYVSRPTYA